MEIEEKDEVWVDSQNRKSRTKREMALGQDKGKAIRQKWQTGTGRKAEGEGQGRIKLQQEDYEKDRKR